MKKFSDSFVPEVKGFPGVQVCSELESLFCIVAPDVKSCGPEKV